ncbi:MAG: homoserine O-acetyltransferase [Actinomycetota bacterium]
MAISYDGPPPASAAWREGDHPGRRKFADLGPLALELGGELPHLRMAYETFGTLNADENNAVLILHALTGDSHVSGADTEGHLTRGWWDGLVGPGKGLDTRGWFLVCPNVLGGCQGTTGPASPAPDGRPWGARFPRTTIRDQVAADIALSDALGIERWAAVIGGSMGGMRALEWAVMAPERVGAAVVLSACAAATADQIGWCAPQLGAIRGDPRWRGGDYYDAQPGDGPHVGLGIARQIGHLSYRSASEMDLRFGRHGQPGEDPLRTGRYAVESYLDHHADKLARRFDANSYVVLTEAMNSHDIGRGRAGVGEVLAAIQVPLVVGGVTSDRLYPVRLQREIAEGVSTCDGVREIGSPHGHDGFLIETEAVGAIVREALDRSSMSEDPRLDDRRQAV